MTRDNTASNQEARFFEELRAIWEDARLRSLALRRAGDPGLADDAFQSAYDATARVEHPQQIENLRAYFYRVLLNEIHRRRGQANALASLERLPEEDPHAAVGSGPAQAGLPRESTTALMARQWLERLSAHRDRLTTAIPGRSPDPGRYRDLIAAVAEQVLGGVANRHDSEPDSNEALGAAYPEWFSEADRSPANRHQRLTRARRDVRNLIQAVIQPEADSRDAADLEPASSDAWAATPQATAQRDEQVRAADDATLSALFHESEHVRLPHEAPYDLERELKLFTEWLDREE